MGMDFHPIKAFPSVATAVPRTPRGHSDFVSAHPSLAAEILEPHHVSPTPPIHANELPLRWNSRSSQIPFHGAVETRR